MTTEELIAELRTLHPQGILDVCADPYANYVATAGADGTIRIYALGSGAGTEANEPTSVLTHHRGAVARLYWLPAAYGNALLSAGHDGLLILWQDSGHGVWTISSKHQYDSPLADLSVTGGIACLMALDGVVALYSIEQTPVTLDLLCIGTHRIQGVPLVVSATAWNGGLRVACGLLSGHVLVYVVSDSGQGKQFTEVTRTQCNGLTTPIRGLAWGSPLLTSCPTLAVGYESGSIFVYDASSDALAFSAPIYREDVEAPLTRLSYGPTGTTLAVAFGNDGTKLIYPFGSSTCL
ncbi:Sec13 [Giardia muris]|uniref:Sec13 n=1 Tax=Giardia muris TaxID=5742 RepID=A0A4Z1SLC7_GIAMU|nr:Sec13 [Giardia muris]|eukprot:TNJ26442.1 Sec13 [Giardia muris]